jgi:hypothetical protein
VSVTDSVETAAGGPSVTGTATVTG